MKEDCFFMIIIRGQGGREYHCDLSDNYPDCETCACYVNPVEASYVMKQYILERFNREINHV